MFRVRARVATCCYADMKGLCLWLPTNGPLGFGRIHNYGFLAGVMH